MIVHQIYAIVLQEEIKNIIVCDNYELANQIGRLNYGVEAFAVDCQQYPCGIGDTYRNGIFYRKETDEEIERIPTDSEKISGLETEKERLETHLTETQIALCDLYETVVE